MLMMEEGTYTAMKPDAPVTSTFDPDLIAGIIVVVVYTDDRRLMVDGVIISLGSIIGFKVEGRWR
jgi:hypothetical protein